MKKEEVLAQLKLAKSVHADWLYKAKILASTKDTKENFTPLDYSKCPFGEWFKSEGQKLSALSNIPLECMQNIIELHQNIHETYFKIFSMYYPEVIKKGLLSKLFVQKKQILDEDESAFVSLELKKIETLSAEILDDLGRLERRVVAVSDEKIEALD